MPASKMGRPPKTKAEREKEKKEKMKLAAIQEKDMKSMTKGELVKYTEDLQKRYNKMSEGAYCYLCGNHKPKAEFYKSTDPMCKSGVTPVCKECAKGIARRRDKNGKDHAPTKESVQLALFYLNKPFFEELWDASMDECNNANNATKKPENYDVYASYIKNVAMPQYVNKTWKDSDIWQEKVIYEDEKTPESIMEGREDQDTYRDFLKNKKDVKRLLSYDPFEKESMDDQPFLYSQLLGLLDAGEDSNDDMMRTASCISIVRGFLQQSKIDDTIAKLMSDMKGLDKNAATIKSLQDSKSKITSIIKDLAAESCISLRNNKSAKKGENTFTGKLSRLGKMALRESENNGFDIETCKGMQQVANISMNAIVDKLSMDESEWADMVKEQRFMVEDALKKARGAEEAFRLVLRENLDLRKELFNAGLLDDRNLISLENIINDYIESGDVDEE